MPKLIAIREHRYGGKLQKPGDAFEATNKHANLLTRVKKARYAEAETAPMPKGKAVEPTEPENSEASPAKRAYKRRDLKAES